MSGPLPSSRGHEDNGADVYESCLACAQHSFQGLVSVNVFNPSNPLGLHHASGQETKSQCPCNCPQDTCWNRGSPDQNPNIRPQSSSSVCKGDSGIKAEAEAPGRMNDRGGVGGWLGGRVEGWVAYESVKACGMHG